jgi:hypothetical protein
MNGKKKHGGNNISAAILSLATELVRLAEGRVGNTITVTITATPRTRIVIHSMPEAVAGPSLSPGHLTPLQERILRSLTLQPAPAKQIANRVQHKFDSHFRTALAVLCEHGSIRRTRKGYALETSASSMLLAGH